MKGRIIQQFSKLGQVFYIKTKSSIKQGRQIAINTNIRYNQFKQGI